MDHLGGRSEKKAEGGCGGEGVEGQLSSGSLLLGVLSRLICKFYRFSIMRCRNYSGGGGDAVQGEAEVDDIAMGIR